MQRSSSLIFALAMAASIAAPGRAELFKNAKFEGSIETKSFGIDNETDRNKTTDDYRSETNVRTALGVGFDVLDDVHGKLLLTRTPSYGQGAPSIDNITASTLFHNAYAKVDKIFGHVDLTLGRQFYRTGEDLVIYFGFQPDDRLSVTSADMFRVDSNIGDKVSITGIFGKTTEGLLTGANTSNADTDVYGVDANTDKVIPKGNLSGYYYTRKNKNAASTGSNDTLNVFGARANGSVPVVNGLGYRAEYVQNTGRNGATAGTPAYKGNALFFGATLDQSVKTYPIRAKLSYGRGTDDFRVVAAGKRFGKIWGEHTITGVGISTLNGVGGAGLSNLRVIEAGLGTTCPKTKIGADFNWYNFRYFRRTSAQTTGLSNTSHNAGNEFDFILSYNHSENVSLEASAALFKVGDALNNAAGTDTSDIKRIGADVKIRF